VSLKLAGNELEGLARLWRLSVQPGDLVRTTRARIGVPAGTLGLIIKSQRNNFNDFWIYTVEAVAGSKIKSFQATSSVVEKV
jgi:hypothetical protein